MKRYLLIGALLLAAVPLSAEEIQSNQLVTCEVRWIEMLRPEANKIFSSTDYELSPEQLRQINEQIAQKKALILGQPRVTTFGNAQAQVRDVTEFIYPTEYVPLEDPSEKTASSATTSNLNINLTIQTHASTPTPRPSRTESVIVPSGFRTREVGQIFNVTPTVEPDGSMIRCTMVPEMSIFGGFYEYSDPTQKQPIKLQQPKFYTYSVQTTIRLKSGQTVLLALHDGKHYQDADKVIVALFSAAIRAK